MSQQAELLMDTFDSSERQTDRQFFVVSWWRQLLEVSQVAIRHRYDAPWKPAELAAPVGAAD
jgi:hypothetical protein